MNQIIVIDQTRVNKTIASLGRGGICPGSKTKICAKYAQTCTKICSKRVQPWNGVVFATPYVSAPRRFCHKIWWYFWTENSADHFKYIYYSPRKHSVFWRASFLGCPKILIRSLLFWWSSPKIAKYAQICAPHIPHSPALASKPASHDCQPESLHGSSPGMFICHEPHMTTLLKNHSDKLKEQWPSTIKVFRQHAAICSRIQYSCLPVAKPSLILTP